MISLNSGDVREISFLYQRNSVLAQHFNAVVLFMTVCWPLTTQTEDRTYFLFSVNYRAMLRRARLRPKSRHIIFPLASP